MKYCGLQSLCQGSNLLYEKLGRIILALHLQNSHTGLDSWNSKISSQESINFAEDYIKLNKHVVCFKHVSDP